MIYQRIKTILPHFQFVGEYVSATELQSGNVNETYHLVYSRNHEHHYILQRVNTYVFKNPQGVMHNISMVTSHLCDSLRAQGKDPKGSVLSIIRTREGELLYTDDHQDVWRAYGYILGATAHDAVSDPRLVYEVGRGFGNFQSLLSNFPANELYEPIPNFHNTRKRFYAFVRSLDEDKAGHVHELEDEIEFMFERRLMMSEIVKLLDAGVLPLRVTHNDTKSNNVMIDDKTGKAICVIDLDTVMPGSSLYDYGDGVRFGCSTAAEDEEDTSKIKLDVEKFTAFTEGYLSETSSALVPAELSRLVLGIKVITCELAMRFLMDYIDGNVYFRVNSPQHNLVRARAQMALLRDIERRERELERIVGTLIR